MKLKNLIGMVVIVSGVVMETIGYQFLGFLGVSLLIGIGIAFMWSAIRDHELSEPMDDIYGDRGGWDDLSGDNAGDGADAGGNN